MFKYYVASKHLDNYGLSDTSNLEHKERGDMQLFVTMLMGNKIVLMVMPSDLVESVKAKIMVGTFISTTN